MRIDGIEEMIDDPSLDNPDYPFRDSTWDNPEPKENEQLVIEGLDIFKCNPDESLGMDEDDNEGSTENR